MIQYETQQRTRWTRQSFWSLYATCLNTSGSEVSTLLRETTFTSDGNDCATDHSRVQLPDDVSVGTKEDHSNARLRLLDLHVLYGLLQEGSDGAPVLTLAALVVADTAGTVDEECEVDQTTGRCNGRPQHTRDRRSRQ